MTDKEDKIFKSIVKLHLQNITIGELYSNGIGCQDMKVDIEPVFKAIMHMHFARFKAAGKMFDAELKKDMVIGFKKLNEIAKRIIEEGE